MDLKDELIGLQIFNGSFLTELEKTFGTSTIKAILNRLGAKPGELVAQTILEKYGKTQEKLNIPSVAFSLFQNTITKLFDTEILEQEVLKDRIVIKIKNVCILRNVIITREELEYGGTLCEFGIGYFETALQILTGMKVEYKFLPKETTEEFCMVKIIFYKKEEDLVKSTE